MGGIDRQRPLLRFLVSVLGKLVNNGVFLTYTTRRIIAHNSLSRPPPPPVFSPLPPLPSLSFSPNDVRAENLKALYYFSLFLALSFIHLFDAYFICSVY